MERMNHPGSLHADCSKRGHNGMDPPFHLTSRRRKQEWGGRGGGGWGRGGREVRRREDRPH